MRSARELTLLFQNSGTIVVPPGEYRIGADGPPIRLQSNQRILAHGARFLFPESLPDAARAVAFEGVDVHNVTWEGGFFGGHCFDPAAGRNTWEPNVNTRGIVFRTAETGCRDIAVRDVGGEEVAGAVISVSGRHATGSSRTVERYAENVTVRDCTLENCGKFMWDYGLLWQILGWPEEYSSDELETAERYFPAELLVDGVSIDAAENRIRVAEPGDWSDVCFFGPATTDAAGSPRPDGPKGGRLVRGKRYFVVERGEDWIRVAETPDGPPIRLDAATEDRGTLRIVHHLHRAYMELYAPAGSGPGKGAVDLTACRNTILSGNRLSARGDTMHIHSCRTNVFSGNQITASRMGAFFLSEWCSDSTIVANTVHGTNGSRVMSVEKSNRDVTIIGNTFRGGGRGSWINQPENIVIQGNVFINNTTKGEADPQRGRRTFETGDYERRSELYFTTHEPDGRYGPAIVHDNIFQTGPEAVAAIELHAGGHDISIRGNQFGGFTSRVVVDDSCERVRIDQNGGDIRLGETDVQ